MRFVSSLKAQFWKLLKTLEKAVLELSKYVSVQPIGYLPNAVVPIVSQNKALTKQYEDIKLIQLKLHCLHQNLNQAQANQLQAFIQWVEEIKRQTSFDGWRLQQVKALQLELLQRNQVLQRELVTAQRQASLRDSETQKKLQPMGLVAANIFNSHDESAIIPLRVFWVPPQLQLERFAATATQGFLNIELTLAESLRQFFRKYSVADRPIDFIAGALVSQPDSEASVKSLFSVLKSEPTLVLESEVNGDFLNFRFACWGTWSKYRYEPVISRLPYREILNQSAKARAEKWLETREKLIAAGENLEEIDALYGGDNPKNLETLQRERKCRRVGIDIDEIDFNYSVNKQDVEHLCQFLAIYQCLFAGLVIDEYFLVQYSVAPLLPRLLADLTVNVPDSEVKSITQAIVSYYQNLYQLLNQRSSLMPELALDLAQSFMELPNLTWTKQQIIDSVKCWLKLRNLEQPDDLHALLEKLSLALTKEDYQYIQRLNLCLAAVDVQISLNVEQAYYKRGIICFQEENYEAAIFEFAQVIQLKPDWAEVYYSRGLAQAFLEHYQEAIADYNQALQLNQQWKEVYYSRGNAYYRLGAHFKAIADYERALNIDPDFEKAKSQRALVQEVIKSLKHKRRQERVYKHWVNNLAVKEILSHAQSVGCLAVSPDGTMLASGSSDRTVKLWELNTGTEIRTLTGHFGEVEAITISPDGDILASGRADTTVRLWELKTGRELCRLDHPHKVRSLAFNPNGQILASGLDNGIIKLWELKTGKEPRNEPLKAILERCAASPLAQTDNI